MERVVSCLFISCYCSVKEGQNPINGLIHGNKETQRGYQRFKETVLPHKGFSGGIANSQATLISKFNL